MTRGGEPALGSASADEALPVEQRRRKLLAELAELDSAHQLPAAPAAAD